MKLVAKRLNLLAFVLVFPTVYAQSPSPIAPVLNLDNTPHSNDPLRGVVINRTVTVMGWDFYQYFSAAWREKDMNDRYSITVFERPSARWGSEIWIQYGQKRIYHAYLSPARSTSKQVSTQAVEVVYKNIMDIEVERAVFRDKDLGAEEL